MDGTYVVEGEYLVTVERLSSANPRHEKIKQLASPDVQRKAVLSSLSSDDDNEDDKNVNLGKTVKGISFISKLRNSFNRKQKLKTIKQTNLPDVKDNTDNREQMPVAELSRSLRHDGSDTADEVDDLMYDEVNATSKSSTSLSSDKTKSNIPIVSPPSIEKKRQAPKSPANSNHAPVPDVSDRSSKRQGSKTSGSPSRHTESSSSSSKGCKHTNSSSSSHHDGKKTLSRNDADKSADLSKTSPNTLSFSPSHSASKKESFNLENTVPRVSIT